MDGSGQLSQSQASGAPLISSPGPTDKHRQSQGTQGPQQEDHQVVPPRTNLPKKGAKGQDTAV